MRKRKRNGRYKRGNELTKEEGGTNQGKRKWEKRERKGEKE